MKFTLKHLKYFVTAGEMHSVTKAANRLHVSQPSISSAIQHLEAVTGLQLFVRHHAQGLSLTPSGQDFLHKSKQLLAQADSLSNYAVSLGEEVAGSLRVVGFPTFTPILLPRLMRRFMQQYPAAVVHCDELHQQQIINGLQDGDYELAVTYDMQLPDDIDFIPLKDLPPYIMMGLDHPLKDRRVVSMHELAEHPMVLLNWPISREYFLSLFMSLKLEPKFSYTAQSLGMVRGLVSHGFGYSLFNTPLSSNVALDGTAFRAAAIEEDLQPLRLGVAHLKQYRMSPAAQAFVDILSTHLRDVDASIPPVHV